MKEGEECKGGCVFSEQFKHVDKEFEEVRKRKLETPLVIPKKNKLVGFSTVLGPTGTFVQLFEIQLVG